jgi:hypothetical protein
VLPSRHRLIPLLMRRCLQLTTLYTATGGSVCGGVGVKVTSFGGADVVSVTNSEIGGVAGGRFDADYACIGGDVGGGSFGDVYCDDDCRWRWS